jgi:SOUL heme-binding protein
MIRKIFSLSIAFIAIIFAGLAMAIEEPSFDSLEKAGPIEIRQYSAVIVAETYVDGDLSAASSSGFRLIAGYIFGNNIAADKPENNTSKKIAMIAPVLVEPAATAEKIAMTAPVSVQPQSPPGTGLMQSNRWRVQFTMPREYTLATLPKPLNTAVTLREVPKKTMAVLVFAGFAGAEKVQQKTDELLIWLQKNNKKVIATPQLARYNPPWTLPFLRRNEILVEIATP